MTSQDGRAGAGGPGLPAAFDLRGTVALVTGGGSPSGIGYAAARLLGLCGAAVVVSATSARIDERAAELASEGIEAAGVVADLTDPAQAASVVAAAVERFGRLDILVNNAGMVTVGDGDYLEGDLTATDPARWQASLERNLTTAYLMTRAALPHLRASGRGRVVNVSSVTGAVMAMRSEVAYAAAKAGMVGLTRAVAVDEAGFGITSNAVAPGWIATGSQTESEVREGAVSPPRRSGTAGEVASAIVWLASPGAAYVNGQVVVVDGGSSIAEERWLQG
ncbi:MAG: SDR family NAD(P)-dependent oxidoreductase [Dermatophilaceae bacterium]|nr:SDR family oxidoreductase [Intrasporangiaceae bacterium]